VNYPALYRADTRKKEKEKKVKKSEAMKKPEVLLAGSPQETGESGAFRETKREKA
jgi:hypothetical protein